MPVIEGEGESDPDATVDESTDDRGFSKGTGDATLDGQAETRLKKRRQREQKNNLKRLAKEQAMATGSPPDAAIQYERLPPDASAQTTSQTAVNGVVLSTYVLLPAAPGDIEMSRMDDGLSSDDPDADIDDDVAAPTTPVAGGQPTTGQPPPGTHNQMPVSPPLIVYDILPADAQSQAAVDAQAVIDNAAQDQENQQNASGATEAKQLRNKKTKFLVGGALAAVGGLSVLATWLAGAFDKNENITPAKPKPKAAAITAPASNPWDASTFDVFSSATPYEGGPAIDPASVELVDGDNGSTTTRTVTNIGVWSLVLDAATQKPKGEIRFTPDPNFPGKDVSVFYTIADTGGTRSEKAQLIFPKLAKGTGGPQIAMTTLTPLTPPAVATFDVPALTTRATNGAPIDSASVALFMPDADDASKMTLATQGVWSVDGTSGVLTFTPYKTFRGGNVSTRVTIKSTDGKVSDASQMTAPYINRPTVYDQVVQDDTLGANAISVNVITGVGSGGGRATEADQGGAAIDPTSVVLLGIVPIDSETTPPKTRVTTDSKTLIVEGEGVWTATDPSGLVTFTPEAGFNNSPTQISYQIADINGLASNIGRILFDANLTVVVKQFRALTLLSDDDFWKGYEAELIQGSYAPLDPVADIVGILTIYRDLNSVAFSLMWRNLSMGEQEELRVAVFRTYAFPPSGSIIENDFTNWTVAGRTLQSLFDLSKKVTSITDQQGNQLTSRNATRLARLRYIELMLNRWRITMG